MRRLTTSCSALFIAACLVTSAKAQTWLEEFSSDLDPPLDQFEPETRNPALEPDLGGLPPAAWNDVRNGWSGVIEENLSPVGDTLYPAPDPGALTPEYAVVQPQEGDGPYWSGTQAGFNPLQHPTTITYNVDVYADPVLASNGNGIADWWWTSAVSNVNDGTYLTESGITGTVDPGNATWTFAITGPGPAFVTVPVGQWYELEVEFLTTGPNVVAVHNVWDSTHTVLLGSYTVSPVFLNPASSDLGGPRYSWFTFIDPNVDVLFVDNFKVGAVPEPHSVVMLACGAVGLVAVGRRRAARVRAAVQG